jgi:hypothetical protein
MANHFLNFVFTLQMENDQTCWTKSVRIGTAAAWQRRLQRDCWVPSNYQKSVSSALKLTFNLQHWCGEKLLNLLNKLLS